MGYCIAVMTVYVGSLLIEKPTPRMHFISGIFIGFSALVGRNYGLYTVIIFVLLTLLIWHRFARGPIFKRLAILGLGGVIGYSPLLIVMIVEPGFFDAFMQTISLIIERGQTNISKPIPWPWRYELSQLKWADILKVCSIGGMFVLIPLVLLSALFYWFRFLDKNDKKYAPLLSGLITSIIFFHYALSRPDLTHLADAIPPFLILVFILPCFVKGFYGRAFSQFLSVLVILMTVALSSVFIEPISRYLNPENYVKVNIRGDALWVKKQTARKIVMFRDIVNQKVGKNENVLFAPYLPGMYPIVDQKSPVKTSYFLYPEEDQFEMIKHLENENVNWAIISLTAIKI